MPTHRQASRLVPNKSQMSTQKVNRQTDRTKFSRMLKWIVKIKVEMIFSLLAICISGYTLWDNTFREKIDVSTGKQVDLYVGAIEHSPLQPIIHMNIEFVNSGGKTAFLDDIKLNVDFKVDDQSILSREFISVREIKNSIIDISEISGVNRGISEVSPIVIIGRTSVLKKYVFFPSGIDSSESDP